MPKRKPRVEAVEVLSQPQTDKPRLPALDPLAAAQEAAAHAQEGNVKLARAVDILRGALETVVMAEMNLKTQQPTTTDELRGIAIEGLTAYSRLTGQNWKRHKLIGSWAGDRNLSNVEEYDRG